VIARIRRSQLVRHGALVFGGVVVASLANYLFYILISRRAGVETYGVVTSLISAILVLCAPATVVQLIAARLAADLEVRGDLPALRKLSDGVTLWTAAFAAVFVLAGILAREPLAGFFNLTSTGPIVISAITFGLLTIVTAQRGVLQGAHRFGDYAATQTIDGITKVVVGVPLVTPLGASGGLIGLATSSFMAFAYSMYAFRARFGKLRGPLALDRKLIARVVTHVGLGQVTFTVLAYYDVPLIKHAFDAHSAGLYAAASLVGRALLSVLSFVPTLIMPKATSRVAAGRSPLPLLGAALGLSAAAVGVAVVAGWLAPGAVVTLIAGRSFGEAAPIVLPYLAASGALATANIVAAYKMGLHRYDFVIPALVVAAIEIATFAFWHPTLTSAVMVLLVGHVAILCTTLFRLNAPVTQVDQSVNPAASASL
jgi:O-antigen/teichoic acid export membrane protein